MQNNELQKLLKLQKLLSKFQDLFAESYKDSRATIQKLEILLNVYRNQPISISQVGQNLDISKSVLSRAVHDMTILTSRKEKGIGILEVYREPQDLRTSVVKLSKKGVLMVTPIIKEFLGDEDGK